MTFLNPLALLALAAAAIPVIIHLLNLRKLRTVEFSSLRFLKELQKSTIRRLRLRQILLLIVRALIIASLVLAFARPALRGSLAGFVGGRASSAIAIVLDDSPSMALRNRQGGLFDQAREAATHALTLADAGDDVFLFVLSGTSRDTAPPAPISLDAAPSTLRALDVSAVSVPLDSAVSRAVRTLSVSGHPNRELVVITDGQATQWTDRAGDSLGIADERIHTYIVQLPPDSRDNIAAGDVSIGTRIVSAGTPVRIAADVRNPGARASTGSILSVYLDGARTAQQSVDIPPGGTATRTMAVTPRRRGVLAGYTDVQDEALEIDNRRHFVLTVPEQVSVLLSGPSDTETRYAHLAIALGGDSTMAGIILLRDIAPDRLAGADVRDVDVIVLCGVPRFTADGAERLARFVRGGGALVLFPGPGIDVRSYSDVLYPALGLPMPVYTETAPGTGGSPRGVLTFAAVDYAHPLFEGLFEQRSAVRSEPREIESPSVTTAFSPRPASDTRAVIALSNGQAFFAEHRLGDGSVIVCAVDAGLAWSDFAVKGAFVPLLHRIVLYLGAQEVSVPSLTAGDVISLTLRRADVAGGDEFFLRGPDGEEQRLAPQPLSGGRGWKFAAGTADQVGVYTLFRTRPSLEPAQRTAIVQAVPVNTVPRESDLTTIDDERRNAFLRRAGLSPELAVSVDTPSSLSTTVTESRFGVELWRYFVAIALILALVELGLGRAPRRSAPSPV